MCELLAMSSLQPARLSFSLQALSSHSASGTKPRDGWGVAYFQGRDVALFREPGAAFDSPLVHHLETQGPQTKLAISHIRHATRGTVSLANTQPFVRELAGAAQVFAHNGDLPGLLASRPTAGECHHPIGDTDSEHAFCILLERMRSAHNISGSPPSLEHRLEVVATFAEELRRMGPANFLYADGEVLFAHGHRRVQPASGRIEAPGLHLVSLQCTTPGTSIDVRGVTVSGTDQQVVLVASVALSDASWRPLADGEVVAIANGQVLASQAA